MRRPVRLVRPNCGNSDEQNLRPQSSERQSTKRTINLPIDEETYRLAKIRAARQGKSVSGLAHDLLVCSVRQNRDGSTGSDPMRNSDAGRHSKLLSDLFADFDAHGVGLCMDDNLPQDALYRRDATG